MVWLISKETVELLLLLIQFDLNCLVQFINIFQKYNNGPIAVTVCGGTEAHKNGVNWNSL